MRKGISLIETIIAITLIAIIITPLVLYFDSTIKFFHTANPSYKTVSVVNDAMNEITDTLRQAKDVGISEETKVGFIVPLNDGRDEMKIIFSADTSNYLIVREDDNGRSYVPYYNNPDTPDEDRVLLKLQFTYYDEDGDRTTDPARVRVVEVSISAISKIDPERTSRVDMKSVVTLRNRKE